MLMNTKGQVTVPAEIRAKQGWRPGDEFEFVEEDGQVVLRPVPQEETRGQRFVRGLRGKGTANMDKTTDELMEMLRGE
ncbi:AbrB/MazE/SpoVT family DNA-binding domain-containing protein [Glycomyces sp. YM15]|uniref:AbrB/MazE/SpoVT family DNA-binding domain-containing protein n=1 Tax=Glycomyces sp. YM15 TaxID=2800446 RepID=UPI0019641607|nr:AbrB/MazE/SpoVT family DNA-binding domain-containing protein [Glycomyces sp. YM15]